VFGSSTTSNYFNGPFFLNTNGSLPYSFATFKPLSSSRNYLVIDSGSASLNAGLLVGHADGTSSMSFDNDGSGNLRILGNGAPMSIGTSGGNLTLTAPTITAGINASSAHIWNGGTHTIAHNPQVNTDVWKWPSAGGTITNGTSLTVLNTLTVSNLVVQGPSTISSGTNVTMTASVNGGAGQFITSGKYLFATNTESATAFALNTIYTNANQRMIMDANLVFGANSAAMFYTVSGSQTNIFSRKFFSAAGTNNVTGFVQPNGLYVISNYVGTVTPLVGEVTRILE
jgi:hypothetical protein